MNRLNKHRKPEPYSPQSIDEASWLAIKGQRLVDAWPGIETHIAASIADSAVERMQLIRLDALGRLLESTIIAHGTVDHLCASVRYVAEQALKDDTFGVILAHNHTGGSATPSWDDVTYTKSVHHAFKLLHIALIDHLIVTKDKILSMRRNCLIF